MDCVRSVERYELYKAGQQKIVTESEVSLEQLREFRQKRWTQSASVTIVSILYDGKLEAVRETGVGFNLLLVTTQLDHFPVVNPWIKILK